MILALLFSFSIHASLLSCGNYALGNNEIRVAHDDGSVYVYQAFSQATAAHAVRNQKLLPGYGFKTNRMTWLKLSLPWMLHRSQRATSPRQERILRIRISRTFFDEILRSANSALGPEARGSEVIYQWDPDRSFSGQVQERRTLQLGIRGSMIKRYSSDEVLEIRDITKEVLALTTENPTFAERPYTPLKD